MSISKATQRGPVIRAGWHIKVRTQEEFDAAWNMLKELGVAVASNPSETVYRGPGSNIKFNPFMGYMWVSLMSGKDRDKRWFNHVNEFCEAFELPRVTVQPPKATMADVLALQEADALVKNLIGREAAMRQELEHLATQLAKKTVEMQALKKKLNVSD